MLKFSVLLIFVSLFISTGAAAQTDSSTLTKVGDIAPNFNFELEKAKNVSLSDYRGKIVLLNFFATWCPPCRMELPRIEKDLWAKYKDHPRFALFVFGREQGWNVLLPFKRINKFSFPILPDENRKIFSKYATLSIPRNILIDEKGIIIYQSIEYTPQDFDELLKLLEGLLAIK